MINIPTDTKYYITSSLRYKAETIKEERDMYGFDQKFKENKERVSRNKDFDAQVSGGAGSGGSGKDGSKVENIMTGEMGAGDVAGAAAMYGGGMLGSLFGKDLAKATKIAGLGVARKFAPGGIGRLAGKVGADLATNIVDSLTGQLVKLSGYDFVNKNLGNIADEQMNNIMQGYGKKSFVIPKTRSFLPRSKKEKTT